MSRLRVSVSLETGLHAVHYRHLRFATVRGAQQVPITIRISRSGKKLNAAFLNGPAAHPDETPASSVTWNGSHIVASFDYFARTLDATLSGDSLTGTYGSTIQKAAGTSHAIHSEPRAKGS